MTLIPLLMFLYLVTGVGTALAYFVCKYWYEPAKITYLTNSELYIPLVFISLLFPLYWLWVLANIPINLLSKLHKI